MLRKHMAACLMLTALTAAPALAQTNTSSQNAGAMAGKFMTQQSQNQWRASKLVGLVIYGTNNERIGDVNEVLVDNSGNAEALVVGVGGFLGLGEKNVAVPFKSVEWKMTSDTNRTAATPGGANTGASNASVNTTSGTGTTASGPANTTSGAANTNSGAGTGTTGNTTSAAPPATGTAANTTSTTNNANTAATANTTGTAGTAGTAGANRAANTSSDMNRGYPDHGVLRMSKADLENAPTFRYAGDTASTTGTGTGTNTNAPANQR